MLLCYAIKNRFGPPKGNFLFYAGSLWHNGVIDPFRAWKPPVSYILWHKELVIYGTSNIMNLWTNESQVSLDLDQ